MAIYIKRQDGTVSTVASNIIKKFNTKWYPCIRTVENGQEFYDVDSSIVKEFSSLESNTLYAFGFSEPNTTNEPILRFNGINFIIRDFTRDEMRVKIGNLKGVFQMFTQNLDDNYIIYFCGDTHKDEGIISANITPINFDEPPRVDVIGSPGETTLNFNIPTQLPALVLQANIPNFNPSQSLNRLMFIKGQFNREPIVNDGFLGLTINNYILICTVREIVDRYVYCDVENCFYTKGDTSLFYGGTLQVSENLNVGEMIPSDYFNFDLFNRTIENNDLFFAICSNKKLAVVRALLSPEDIQYIEFWVENVQDLQGERGVGIDTVLLEKYDSTPLKSEILARFRLTDGTTVTSNPIEIERRINMKWTFDNEYWSGERLFPDGTVFQSNVNGFVGVRYVSGSGAPSGFLWLRDHIKANWGVAISLSTQSYRTIQFLLPVHKGQRLLWNFGGDWSRGGGIAWYSMDETTSAPIENPRSFSQRNGDVQHYSIVEPTDDEKVLIQQAQEDSKRFMKEEQERRTREEKILRFMKLFDKDPSFLDKLERL